jgi:nitrate reductase NapAB chaperone NapD
VFGVNLSGILVTADAAHLGTVLAALEDLPGVELHQHDAQTGRIVLVQEAADVDGEVAGFMRIRQLPHVLNVDLVCHCFGDTLPPDDEAAAAAP